MKNMQDSVDEIKMELLQLNNDILLNELQYGQISHLIFETDKYIYPALFAGDDDPIKNAMQALPRVLRDGTDCLFSMNNIFACFLGDDIVGIILWIKDMVEWDYKNFMEIAFEAGVSLIEENVLAVNNSYFEERYNVDNTENKNINYISIVNVCVDVKHRGKGVGEHMINNFIEIHKSSSLELCVLSENNVAVNLYHKCGFEIKSTYQGFALGSNKPLCYEMIRI